MIAILSDIHGNLPALEAVLADAERRGADRFVLVGDYAALGVYPAEAVARLDALSPEVMIRGNHERWLTDAHDVPAEVVHGAIAWEAERLGDATVARLAALPAEAAVGTTLIVHASPQSDVDSFLPEPEEDDESRLEGVAAPRLVFGHTHLQFRRQHGDHELINPGSVGLPLDGDHRPAYATVDDEGELTLHRVAYDHRAYEAQLRAIGEPWTEMIAGWVADAAP